MIQEKKCTKCKEVKPLSEFSKLAKSKDGLNHYCKLCYNKRVREYRRTKNGLVANIYSHQKQTSKHREHNPPTYTKQELKEWLFNQPLFHKLYDNWKESGYQKMLSPSCDRTDDELGYSLDRLKLMTWKENLDKSHSDIKNGINNKISKKVIGTHIITGEIVKFHSMSQAQRELGISQGNISACCCGIKESASGFTWEFNK